MRALVYEQELAVYVGVDWSWRRRPRHVPLPPGAQAGRRRAEGGGGALRRAASGWPRRASSERELEKAKNNLRAHLLREFATNNGRAHALGTYELFLGGWQHGFGLPEAYGRIDAAKVRAAARRWLDPTQRSVVTLVPEDVRT